MQHNLRPPPGRHRPAATPDYPQQPLALPGCENVVMAVSRAERRKDREPRVRAVFADRHAKPVLDLLELLELAWHDCYHEISPSEDIIDDVLLLSDGSMDKLVSAARLAVTDWRDLKVAAAAVRSSAT
jgi:hypothetical protein